MINNQFEFKKNYSQKGFFIKKFFTKKKIFKLKKDILSQIKMKNIISTTKK